MLEILNQIKQMKPDSQILGEFIGRLINEFPLNRKMFKTMWTTLSEDNQNELIDFVDEEM